MVYVYNIVKINTNKKFLKVSAYKKKISINYLCHKKDLFTQMFEYSLKTRMKDSLYILQTYFPQRP